MGRAFRGEWFDSINPATNTVVASIAQGSPADVDQAVRAARAAQPGWWDIGGHARARYLYAIARGIQKHSRLFAVLESIDNGKPIRESRDIDIPLVARHFYHHAGWAQLMESELPGYEPVGVVGQIIPWNFPCSCWRGRSRRRSPREHGGAQAGRVHAADRARVRRAVPEVGPAAGVVNIVTGDGRPGPRWSTTRRRQDRLHRFDRGRPDHPRRHRRQRQEALASSWGEVAVPGVRGRRPRQRRRGVVDAIWFNQGQVCCAGSRILAQEGVAERWSTSCGRGWRPCAWAIRSTRRSTSAPSWRRCSSSGSRAGADRAGRGRTIWQPSWSVPARGLVLSADPVHRRGAVVDHRAGGDLRAGGGADDVPHPGRGGRTGQRHALRTGGERLDGEHQPGARRRPKSQAGSVWVNCTNVFDAASGFGGYRESGFGREGGAKGCGST